MNQQENDLRKEMEQIIATKDTLLTTVSHLEKVVAMQDKLLKINEETIQFLEK